MSDRPSLTIQETLDATEEEILALADFVGKGEPFGPEDLTPSQRRQVRRLVLAGVREATNRNENYRAVLKRFKVRRLYRRRISVWLVTYRKDLDPRAIGRLWPTQGHFFVGRCGGLEIAGIDSDPHYEGRRTRARKHPIIYGFHS